jgi:hypothetical protein
MLGLFLSGSSFRKLNTCTHRNVCMLHVYAQITKH